eukprot:7862966-Pyramimonas_sp.AAC.1
MAHLLEPALNHVRCTGAVVHGALFWPTPELQGLPQQPILSTNSLKMCFDKCHARQPCSVDGAGAADHAEKAGLALAEAVPHANLSVATIVGHRAQNSHTVD